MLLEINSGSGLNEEVELMDTPGILWPKFDDMQVGLNLAYTGAIKDDIMDITEVAANLLQFLSISYPKNLIERFKLKTIENMNGFDLLNQAGRNRGCIISGGQIDLMRISAIVLDELRGGKIGRISFERPDLTNGEA